MQINPNNANELKYIYQNINCDLEFEFITNYSKRKFKNKIEVLII